MPTTLGTGHPLPTTTTRTTATLFCRSSRTAPGEHVTIEEVFDAYYDCRRHKRNKRSAVEYELNYELNNYRLWKELNDMSYHPTTSIVFCVTKPKLREVFAADFRDRVVHHLFVNRIKAEIERRLSDSSGACRTGKGTLYCARRLKRMMDENPGAWYARCDISGFFMSIDKDILISLVNDVVCDAISGEGDGYASSDLGWWLWLADTVIMHRPETDCERHGNVGLFDLLPKNKSLFHTEGIGLPIGNLTSQIFENLYLSEFDRMVVNMLGSEMRYIRYVDDFIMIHPDRKVLLEAVGRAREWLATERHLSLHGRKVTVQKVERGVRFVGYFIKGGVIHTGRRVRGNAIYLCRAWSLKESHTDEERRRLLSRYNSYSGLLKHTASYRTRRKMWRSLGNYENIININMDKIKLRRL